MLEVYTLAAAIRIAAIAQERDFEQWSGLDRTGAEGGIHKACVSGDGLAHGNGLL